MKYFWYVVCSILIGTMLVGCFQNPSDANHEYSTYKKIGIEDNSNSTYINTVAWHPNGQTLAIGAHVAVYTFEIQTESLSLLRPDAGGPQSLEWSQDGRLLGGGSNTLWIWDPVTNEISSNTGSPRPYDWYFGIFWMPEDNTILSTFQESEGESYFTQWNFETNNSTLSDNSILQDPTLLDLNASEALLAILTDDVTSIQLLEYPNLNLAFTVDPESKSQRFLSASWSPDSSMLATRTDSSDILIWDLDSNKIIQRLSGFSEPARDTAWHPTSNWIATASIDSVIIWNVQTGANAIVQGEGNTVVEWSPDGNYLATAVEDQVFIWNIVSLP